MQGKKNYYFFFKLPDIVKYKKYQGPECSDRP